MISASPEIAEIANDLLNEFENSQWELVDNSLYYESEKRPNAIGLATPPEMRKLDCRIGWCRIYVDSLEERLDVEGFRLGTAKNAHLIYERLWSWWQYNDLDEWAGLGHTEAMIHGRAYVTVSAPEPGNKFLDPDKPIIRVESATSMWADIDPRTHQVTRAIRVIYREDGSQDPDRLTVYLPNITLGLIRSTRVSATEWDVDWEVRHNLGIVPVIPLLNRSRLTEWYGKSEISSELRSVTDAASRLMMNMQATAELMAIPQRILFGVDKDELLGTGSDKISVFEAYIARILAFTGDNDKMSAHQFQAAELRNFGDGMEMLAKEASKATGLPPQYLAVQSDNPASADAIRAAETRLVKKAERKQKMFGGAWEQVMRLALLIMDGDLPEDVHRLETVWRNAATPTIAAMADAVVKLASAQTASGEQILPTEQARILLDFTEEERIAMRESDRQTPRRQLNDVLNPPRFSDNPLSEED